MVIAMFAHIEELQSKESVHLYRKSNNILTGSVVYCQFSKVSDKV